jgi:O-antigen/teichoic acid export membrane protein
MIKGILSLRRSNLLINSGWLFTEKFVQSVISLILTAGIARHLGPLQFGQLTFATTYIAFFFVVATLSLDSIIVRDLSQSTKNAGSILGSCFVIRIVSGLLTWVCALGALLLFPIDQNDNIWLILIVGSTLIIQAFQTIDLWFQSQSKAFLGVTGRLLAFGISTVIKIILLLSKAPMLYFAFALAFDALASAACLAFVYAKHPCPTPWNAKFSNVIQLLKSSWPLALSGLAITIFMKVDQLMVASILGNKALGNYATAATLSQGLAFIPAIIAAVNAPAFAALRIADRTSYQTRIALLVRYTAIFAALLCIVLSTLSPIIVSTVFGTGFYDSISVFSLLVFNNIFVFVGLIQGIFIINESLQRITLIATVVAAICALTLNFLLVPIFGLAGACFSVILSNFISVTLIPLASCKQVRELYGHAFLNRINRLQTA